jgi:hypothetical protein
MTAATTSTAPSRPSMNSSALNRRSSSRAAKGMVNSDGTNVKSYSVAEKEHDHTHLDTIEEEEEEEEDEEEVKEKEKKKEKESQSAEKEAEPEKRKRKKEKDEVDRTVTKRSKEEKKEVKVKEEEEDEDKNKKVKESKKKKKATKPVSTQTCVPTVGYRVAKEKDGIVCRGHIVGITLNACDAPIGTIEYDNNKYRKEEMTSSQMEAVLYLYKIEGEGEGEELPASESASASASDGGGDDDIISSKEQSNSKQDIKVKMEDDDSKNKGIRNATKTGNDATNQEVINLLSDDDDDDGDDDFGKVDDDDDSGKVDDDDDSGKVDDNDDSGKVDDDDDSGKDEGNDEGKDEGKDDGKVDSKADSKDVEEESMPPQDDDDDDHDDEVAALKQKIEDLKEDNRRKVEELEEKLDEQSALKGGNSKKKARNRNLTARPTSIEQQKDTTARSQSECVGKHMVQLQFVSESGDRDFRKSNPRHWNIQMCIDKVKRAGYQGEDIPGTKERKEEKCIILRSRFVDDKVLGKCLQKAAEELIKGTHDYVQTTDKLDKQYELIYGKRNKIYDVASKINPAISKTLEKEEEEDRKEKVPDLLKANANKCRNGDTEEV